ncbi:GHKL domain-containing protein [Flavobacteriaceae bacterium Ap0902]|nr:GHKL domain-containing protein [Flavobacteriaceae bacterium Ap0902]
MAHEIKNPLTPMRLLIQNFQRRYDPTANNAHERVDELSKGLLKQIDSLNTIVSAFSEFANLPSRHDTKIDLTQVICKSLSIFDEEYINFNAPEEPIYLIIDESSLVRVITNIVKNAFQAIPHHRKAQIDVTITKVDKILQITMKDNGIGVMDDYKDKLFIPKFTTKSSGSGIGLPMVKKIMESYQGTITFRNNRTVGTTFVITLPINEV